MSGEPNIASPAKCTTSNRVSHVDWNSGSVRYEQDCEWKVKVARLDLDATFASPPPGWVSAERVKNQPNHGRWFVVVGRAEKAGPKWQLTDAFILPRATDYVVPEPPRSATGGL